MDPIVLKCLQSGLLMISPYIVLGIVALGCFYRALRLRANQESEAMFLVGIAAGSFLGMIASFISVILSFLK